MLVCVGAVGAYCRVHTEIHEYTAGSNTEDFPYIRFDTNDIAAGFSTEDF